MKDVKYFTHAMWKDSVLSSSDRSIDMCAHTRQCIVLRSGPPTELGEANAANERDLKVGCEVTLSLMYLKEIPKPKLNRQGDRLCLNQ